MATPFNLPALGENIDAGTVVGILVAAGDRVEENQPILEIETDKANLEVPSGFSGVVTEILVENGATTEVGAPVLMYEDAGQAPAAAAEESAAETTEGEGQATIEVAEKLEKAAAESAQAAEVPEPATESEVPSSKVSPASPPAPVSSPPAAVPAASGSQPVPAAPSVRRFAREIGLDIGQVPGTGPAGRISVEDVKSHSRQLSVGRGAPAGPTPAAPLPDFTKWGPVETEPMSNLRRAAADHLSAAWTNIPHVTYGDKADVTDMEALRKQFGPTAEAAGGKLTMTAIALKIAAAALKRFPLFNASVDMSRHEIIYKKYYHVGVAVDTDRGLVVPVIRDVDRKNMIELSVELSEVAAKARDRKLSPDDMQGSTFTISNLGGFGGTFFAPIVNAPDVAILGLARSRMEQVYVDGTFQPRLMLPLMISYDHRLVDGADGARFMQWLVQAFEEPFLLSLEG